MIVPASTFVATLEAVTQAGGTPVVADVGEDDYNLDPAAAEAAIGPRTRALLPVHLYGQLADLRALSALAERHGLAVVEDACQAHGARRDGRAAGATGLAGAFSFYPAKNLGAMGDAGALVTSDAELAARARCSGSTGRRASIATRPRAGRRGWTRSRRSSCCASCRCSTGGTSSAARRPPSTPRLSPALATCGRRRSPAGSEPVWHLYVVRTATPERWPSTSRPTASRPAATTPSRRTSRRRTPGSVNGAGRSRSARRSPRKGSRCRSSPGSRPRSSRPWPTRCAATSAVADGPVNEAPYRLIDGVEFGEDVAVQSFVNLYGCRIGDRTRIGPFVEIQRGVVVGADCKLQSHAFLCEGVDDRGRGLRRARCALHQRQAPARDDR